MVAPQDLATDAHDADRSWTSRRHVCRRQHLCEGPSLGCGRPKKAAPDQAIGVSRGGRSTKIHLATDLLGRPIAIHPTSGQHSDIRSVDALLAKVGACKRFIADRAYDADALRQRLRDSGIKPVIPARRTGSSKSAMTKRPTSSDGASRRRSAGSRTSAAWPPATTSSPEHFAIASHSLQSTCSGCD